MEPKAHLPNTSITIRNLDEDVKKRLRIQAASHGKSMEAEARDILKNALDPEKIPPTTDEEYAARIESVRGSWKKQLGMTTDEFMEMLRGD